jgi:phage N-6-adenine-methyltransferase
MGIFCFLTYKGEQKTMAHTDACKIQASQFIKKLVDSGLSINEACRKTETESDGIPAETLRRWWYELGRQTKEELFKNEQARLTIENNSQIKEKPFERSDGGRFAEGTAPGPGRPPKYQEEKELHFRAQGTGENEWYTPSKYIELARSVLGSIELDPASSTQAQERIKAEAYYTKEENGLAKPWFGSVWLNPPYSQPDIANFIDKLVSEIKSERVTSAILLTHNYTDTSWFHAAESICTAICFSRGRIAFEAPDGTKASPTQGQAFFYFGDRIEKFISVFSEVGFVR